MSERQPDAPARLANRPQREKTGAYASKGCLPNKLVSCEEALFMTGSLALGGCSSLTGVRLCSRLENMPCSAHRGCSSLLCVPTKPAIHLGWTGSRVAHPPTPRTCRSLRQVWMEEAVAGCENPRSLNVWRQAGFWSSISQDAPIWCLTGPQMCPRGSAESGPVSVEFRPLPLAARS